MTVVATGSLAYDYILTFNGRFGDHILADKAHILNLSFLVETMEKRRGGVAGNYAYTLSLLGHGAAVLATIGPDAEEYRAWLEERGIDCRGVRVLPDELTATGFSTVDLDHNGIWGYYGGAMTKAGQLGLADTVPDPEAVIVGPNAPDAMFRLVRECRDAGVRWVFDPAHQLPHMSAEDLVEGARGAWMLIGNDYEVQLIQERTGRDVAGLLELSEMVVTTLGREGSRVATRERTVEIPAAPARTEADPVGAGDAYRAGLVHGLLTGRSLEESGRIASLAGSYVVEQTGTIEHRYTREEFDARYLESFGAALAQR
jgi:adenosine kinase